MRRRITIAGALVAALGGMSAAVAEAAARNTEVIEMIGWSVAGLALAALVLVNGRLGERLMVRDRKLANSAKVIALAERLAGFGRWRVFADGREEWSDGMLRITGYPPGAMPDYETRHALLPEGGKRFSAAIRKYRDSAEPFTFDFELHRADGELRCYRIIAQNEFDYDGNFVQRIGVTMDVTDEKRAIEQLSEACGEAMRRLEEALELAETDALTGLPNRRRAMAEVDRAILGAGRSGEDLALALFDIDHFKGVNDRHGHPAGDAVLVRIGQIARATCRESDIVARIGGEEFLWLLPGAGVHEVQEAAERLRAAVAEGSGTGITQPVTASVGTAIWHPGDTTLKLFARADAALYEAKEGGRNRIRNAA